MRKIRKISILAIGLLLSLTVATARIYDLRCEKLTDPIGINTAKPNLGWKFESSTKGDVQTHYRIIAASSSALLSQDIADIWDSGKVKSAEQIAITYAGKPLKSGDYIYWKVKTWTKKQGEQDWSEVSKFSIGLLDESDWKADYICFAPQGVHKIDSPLLRKSFTLDNINSRYIIHINSLGYHEVYLNGNKIGDAVLQPAVSQSDKRSLICSYEINDYIREGNNELIIWLSEDWSRTYAENRLCATPAVRAQIQEIDEKGEARDILCTNNSWQARESGYSSPYSWRPFEFGGEIVDANMLFEDFSESSLNSVAWSKAQTAEVKPHLATPQMVEAARIIQSIDAKTIQNIGEYTWLIDFGKSITGFTEIEFSNLSKNQKISIEYTDALDSDGNFPATRRGDFCDIYYASAKPREKFANKFNFHGFRYIKISNLRRAPKADAIKAYLIHSDYGKPSSFECSDADLNAVHDMIQYTMQCLTPAGYMIDCPQIERLGYGGDGNSSSPSFQLMYDAAPLMYNWIQAWADAQRADGGMPHTAPAPPYGAGGGPYWCGFIIIASWQSYLHYKDARLISEFYPNMKQWLSYVEKYSQDELLGKWENDPIRRGYFLGDWAAPENVDVQDAASVELVNNCFIALCYDTMAKIARINSEVQQAKQYESRAKKIREKLQSKHYDAANASYATGSQIDLSYPMLAGIAPQKEISRICETLKTRTESQYTGHLNTGLVGVPVIAQWATKAAEVDFMYSMLKKRDYPSYLYMIDNGATTTWEYWNGYRSHIHNCYNGIASWFYEALAGIVVDETHPGYEHFHIRPQVAKGIDYVNVSKNTPYGEMRSEWKIEGEQFTLKISIPFGSSATVQLPGSKRSQKVACGEYIFTTRINK